MLLLSTFIVIWNNMSEYLSEPQAKNLQYQTFHERLATYTDTALDIETKNECARSGLILIRKGNLLCVYCVIPISYEEIKESVFAVHVRKNPNCSYLTFYTKKTLDENIELKNKKYSTLIFQSVYPYSDFDTWDSSPAFQSVVLLGYSNEVVREAAQLLKEQRQSLSVDNLLDHIFSIGAAKNNSFGQVDKVVQGVKPTDDFTPIVKAKDTKQFKRQLGQQPSTSSCEQRNVRQNVTSLIPDNGTRVQSNSSNNNQDNLDGYSLNVSAQHFSTSDVRPKTSAYTSLQFVPQTVDTKRSAKLSTSHRRSDSKPTASSPTDLEEQSDTPLSLGLTEYTEYQSEFNGGKQSSTNLFQSNDEDLGFLEIKSEEGDANKLFEKNETSDVKTGNDVGLETKVSISATSNTERNGGTSGEDVRKNNRNGLLNIAENDTTLPSDNFGAVGHASNRSTPFLSIPPTNQNARGERNRTYSGSSGYQSMVSTAGSSHGAARDSSSQHNNRETVRAAGRSASLKGDTAATSATKQVNEPKQRVLQKQSAQRKHNDEIRAAGDNALVPTTDYNNADSAVAKPRMKMFSEAKQAADANNSNTNQLHVADTKKETVAKSKATKAKKTTKKKHDNSPTRAEYETLFKKQMCNACWKKTANCLYLPCRHLNRCEECSESVEICPKCDDEIIATVKVYFS